MIINLKLACYHSFYNANEFVYQRLTFDLDQNIKYDYYSECIEFGSKTRSFFISVF